MATSTRLLIRQTASTRLGGCITGAITGSVTAPVSTAVDSNNLLDSDDSENALIGNWFMFTEGNNAGTIRRIASYVPASGSVALGHTLSGNTVSGDDYEMQEHLSPTDWNTCINAALRRCTRRREAAVSFTDDFNQISLASLTDLTRDNQILEVWTQTGATGQKRRKRLIKNVSWETYEDDDVVTLNLTYALKADAVNNLELYVAYVAPYAALSTDSATTTCDLDWVVTATLLQAMETYPNQLEEPAKRTLKMTTNDLQKEFRRHSMAQAARRSVTVGARFA